MVLDLLSYKLSYEKCSENFVKFLGPCFVSPKNTWKGPDILKTVRVMNLVPVVNLLSM